MIKTMNSKTFPKLKGHVRHTILAAVFGAVSATATYLTYTGIAILIITAYGCFGLAVYHAGMAQDAKSKEDSPC